MGSNCRVPQSLAAVEFLRALQQYFLGMFQLDTKYDRLKVPPYNGNDPPPAPGSPKGLLFPSLSNTVENKGTARNFLHSFPLSGAPVVQSYCAWTNDP